MERQRQLLPARLEGLFGRICMILLSFTGGMVLADSTETFFPREYRVLGPFPYGGRELTDPTQARQQDK